VQGAGMSSVIVVSFDIVMFGIALTVFLFVTSCMCELNSHIWFVLMLITVFIPMIIAIGCGQHRTSFWYLIYADCDACFVHVYCLDRYNTSEHILTRRMLCRLSPSLWSVWWVGKWSMGCKHSEKRKHQIG
jgi:hypothetical protein